MDFRNINTLWASLLVETLYRLGLVTAVLCPGSRSSPLTLAFAQHPQIETIPILDERSAAFFALGRAKRSRKPVVLVCTSGTAGANFYPAVIEAKESQVPLLILTADRPPELRHCHAGQTIDQIKLYGHYPNWQTELALASPEPELWTYLRQTLIYASEQTQFPRAGVVHLNCPFREPLAPIAQPDILALASSFDPEVFFAEIQASSIITNSFSLTLPQFPQRGIIIAGLYQEGQSGNYCQAIADIAEILDYPVLADALSPLRHFAEINSSLISNYDFILRNQEQAELLTPEIVIQVGELPTSKQLRTWLTQQNIPRYIIDSSRENYDPLHGKSIHLRLSWRDFLGQLKESQKELKTNIPIEENIKNPQRSDYIHQWKNVNLKIQDSIDQTMIEREDLFEGKIPWLLATSLPNQTPIFIANSMPIRDAEFFWKPNNQQTIPYFNRGANGIDGTLSTALGIAHQDQPTILLTGDLSLLHDTNSFLLREKFEGHLTIILINNNGGGIFEMLAIAEETTSQDLFEDYFATPQNINFSQLALTYGIEYQKIEKWETLKRVLNPLPTSGIRLLEIVTHRKLDAQWLKKYLTYWR
jgi:2-succinyl-5-enolpyruvyl-6-hydroxy-3-cyclohexene-1-carboxylate synthase